MSCGVPAKRMARWRMAVPCVRDLASRRDGLFVSRSTSGEPVASLAEPRVLACAPLDARVRRAVMSAPIRETNGAGDVTRRVEGSRLTRGRSLM